MGGAPGTVVGEGSQSETGWDSTPGFGEALEHLASPDEDTRQQAVRALAGSADPRAIDPLVTRLRVDPEQSVRHQAATSLRALRYPAAVDGLIQALRRDRSWQVRSAAAESLGLLGDPRALPALIEAVGPDSFGVSHTAAAAVQAFGSRAIRPLLDAYATAQPARRLALARVLALVARPPVLREILAARQPAYRIAAAQTLALVGESEAVLTMWRSTDWRLRHAAASSLVFLPAAQARTPLLAALHDTDFRVRASALESMACWPPPGSSDPDIVDAVNQALRDPSRPESRTAARALVSLPGAAAAGRAADALQAPEVETRLAIACAFRDASDPRTHAARPGVVIRLHGLLSDAHPGVRRAARAALDALVPARTERSGSKSPRDDEPGQPAEPAPRFADVSLYSGGRKPGNLLPAHATLQANHWYELEVAVRIRPTGIPLAGGERRPVREPKQAVPVELTVTLDSEDFEIPDRFKPLTLPPSGDSTENAWFALMPRARSASADDLARLRVRLFYRYNLLEVLTVHAEVSGSLDGEPSRFGLATPVFFRQESLQCHYIDLDDLRPREMHIEVSRPGQDFVLTFTLADRLRREITLSGSTRVRAPDLEDMLGECRRLLERLALSDTFISGVEGTDAEWRDSLRALARAGRTLWVRLFKSTPRSTLSHVGRMLEKDPLADEGIVQVSIREEAADFVFPWSLLYDRPTPDNAWETPDPMGFWGARYPIDQFVTNIQRETDAPIEVQGPLKLLFLLWRNFRNAQDQIRLMQDLATQGAGKLEVSDPPVLSKNEFYERAGALDSHILYFYTHGHTRRRLTHTAQDLDIEAFAKRFEDFPPDSPARAILQPVYDSLKRGDYEPDRSWIQLTYGKLYLEELQDRISDLGATRPLVILNMCESAQVVPSLADSFIYYFLSCGAATVIGTECPMTVETAHPFARQFLTTVLSGRPAGQALVDTRRYFFARKNPLGLAYTLFGSAMAQLQPPVLARVDPSGGGAT